MSEVQDNVYLDYAATTPVEPRVAEFMARFMTSEGVFANPSAIHVAGRQASEVVDVAAAQLAALLNGDPGRLVWTSGATESNNPLSSAAKSSMRRSGTMACSPMAGPSAPSSPRSRRWGSAPPS